MKRHIVWANGTTHCGRPVRDGDVESPDDATESTICASCLRSHRAAFGVSNPYNTAGGPR